MNFVIYLCISPLSANFADLSLVLTSRPSPWLDDDVDDDDDDDDDDCCCYYNYQSSVYCTVL